MSKDIKPLVTTSNLDTRKVKIKGTNDFSSEIKFNDNQKKRDIKPLIKKQVSTYNEDKNFFENTKKKANRTQKMSDDVILKIDILKPFLKELEDIDKQIKPTINDMVDLLLDNYIQTKLTTKQVEAYQSMYKIRYEQI